MDNNKLYNNALELKEYCKSRENCIRCIFNRTNNPDECDIAFSHFNGEKAAKPEDWELF